MTGAYAKVFLDDAMDNLGNALEYAVFALKMPGQEFLDCFSYGNVGRAFANGEVRYISGMSGIEMAHLVSNKDYFDIDMGDYGYRVDYSAEYWCGWILAYYQWHTGKSFSQISQKISFESLMRLYGVLHEADVTKSVTVLDSFFEKEEQTSLAKMRQQAGLSQRELAREAGVSLRSIQMYEQGHNDIEKAQYNRLKAMAKSLECRIENLIF